jgi:hypothetical protein
MTTLVDLANAYVTQFLPAFAASATPQDVLTQFAAWVERQTGYNPDGLGSINIGHLLK